MADIQQLTWRRGAADDAPLLFALITAEKAEEFAPLALSPEQLQPLLEMQSRARQLSYTQNYPAAVDMILLANGTPVGRHLVERQPDGYRTIDLAILPEHRNSGIGSWALRQLQQLAELEGIPITLRVLQANPALRLYERLGFQKASHDEISFEMQWQPTHRKTSQLTPVAQVKPTPEQRILLSDGRELNRSTVLDTIIAFLREIGLTIHLGSVPNGFLPGVELIPNGLQVDIDTLLYPGDLLHEAGRLAVMPPDRRHADQTASPTEAGEEMAAIAWAYAAALHLRLPTEVVFHDHGYRGRGRDLTRSFDAGNRPGLPLLAWMGLTTQPTCQQPSIFPLMLRWLREAPTNPYDEQPLAEEVHA